MNKSNYWIPDFIIEKLKELERLRQERQYEESRPRVYAPPPLPPLPPEEEEEAQRGPIIIDINSYEIIDEDE
mgnify:CR=1 FL=1